jgi:3-hydroxyisobutyrate dehydrogenase-like beta-hydroxyacid dehydrogenase
MAGRGGVPAVLPIDMTRSSPEVGRVLFHAADDRGIGVLEAPAVGGMPEARAGEAAAFVGGDVALVERHRPLPEVRADRSALRTSAATAPGT